MWHIARNPLNSCLLIGFPTHYCLLFCFCFQFRLITGCSSSLGSAKKFRSADSEAVPVTPPDKFFGVPSRKCVADWSGQLLWPFISLSGFQWGGFWASVKMLAGSFDQSHAYCVFFELKDSHFCESKFRLLKKATNKCKIGFVKEAVCWSVLL